MSNENSGLHNGGLHAMFYEIGKSKEDVARGINERLQEELEAARRRRAQLLSGTVDIEGVDENTTLEELELKIQAIETQISAAVKGQPVGIDDADDAGEPRLVTETPPPVIEPVIEILDVARKDYDRAFFATAKGDAKGICSYAFVILPREGQRTTISKTVETDSLKLAGFAGGTELLSQIGEKGHKSVIVYMEEALCKLLRRNAAFGIVDGYSPECESYVAKAQEITAISDIRFTFDSTESKYMEMVEQTAKALVE